MTALGKAFRFGKNVTIGALADENGVFLKDCIIDARLLQVIQDMADHRRIILGRTGEGKSAPEELARDNSEVAEV